MLVSAQFGNQFNNFQQQQGQYRDPSTARILSDQRAHTVAGDFAVAFKQEDGTVINEEHNSADGVRQGSYSYVDNDGKQHQVKWQAGPGGFQILNSNNLPQLTPAQVEATNFAAKAHREALARAAEAARNNPQPEEQFNPQPQFNPQQQFNPAPSFNPQPQRIEFNTQSQFNPRPQAPQFNPRPQQPQFNPQPAVPQFQTNFPQSFNHFNPQPSVNFQNNNAVPALTPEVAAATAEHFRAVAKAKAAAAQAAATAKPEHQNFEQTPQFNTQPQFQQPNPFPAQNNFQPQIPSFQQQQQQFAIPAQPQPAQNVNHHPGNIQLVQNQNGFQYSLNTNLKR